MTARPVAAIVLSAGGSRRLGQPKQLLPVGQKPLLECTLDVVRKTSLATRILVLGGYADEILSVVDTDGFTVVRNDAYAAGQASSLRAGLKCVPTDAAAVAVVLGDQPLAPSWLIDRLAESFDPERHVAVRPRYADGPGNPVILGRALFSELAELSGDIGARDVLRRYQDQILDIPFPNMDAPRDVDTFEDYQALLLDWSSTGAPDIPRYCQRCGGEVGFRQIHNRLRPVCPVCRFTYYFDPKVAAAVLVEIDGRLVMQQRAIDPGIGKWTFPGGFVDRGEVVREAAIREVREEIGIEIDDLDLIGVYSEPGESVVLVAYHARAEGQQPVIADNESSDIGLFAPGNLPELAFPRNARVVTDWLRLTRRQDRAKLQLGRQGIDTATGRGKNA